MASNPHTFVSDAPRWSSKPAPTPYDWRAEWPSQEAFSAAQDAILRDFIPYPDDLLAHGRPDGWDDDDPNFWSDADKRRVFG